MDIRNFSINGAPPPAQNNPDGMTRQWWKLKKDDAAAAIDAACNFLLQNQTLRQTQLVISARLYGNAAILGAPSQAYAQVPAIAASLSRRLTYNVVQSAIDTGVARIAKNKPKPFFLTNGGDFDQQRKAKKLNRFVDGIFYENAAYDKGTLAFRDGMVWGDGIVHVYPHHNRVRWERVLLHELLVDELEGFCGEPRTMYRVKPVDRGLLMETWPKAARWIREAKPAGENLRAMFPNIADLVMVREAWHLPSGPDADDGAHIVTIDNHALTPMEKWDKPFFPFARFRWNPRLYGYWSQGGAEQLQGIQTEINALLQVAQRAMKLSGGFYVLIENGSKVPKNLITNDIATIIPYTGTKPEWIVPPILPPEFYQQIETLIRRAYDQLGVSQMSATSQKPAGLNSGAALREYNDIESDRFQTPGKEYERFVLDLAKLSIATAKDIAAETGNYEVKVPSGRFLRTIEWKDIDLDEDEYVMQCFPISSLPNDPAGRLQTIQEFIQAGFIPASMGPKLMQFPDIEQYESLANAMEDRLEEILDGIADKGEYTPPEPWLDPQRARELCIQYLLRGESQGLAPERLEMLQTFASQLDVLAEQAQQAAAPGAAMPATPQAQPAQPPVSDLQPFAGGGQQAA